MTHTKRILLLIASVFVITTGCEKTEEPQAPIYELKIKDSSGTWEGIPYPIAATPTIVISKRSSLPNKLRVFIQFNHSVNGSGQFDLHIWDDSFEVADRLDVFELRIPQKVDVLLRFPGLHNEAAWQTNLSENVLFRVTELIEFNGELYASGNMFIRVFSSFDQPSDHEIRGSFENLKVQVD